jgi:NAD+ synthase
MASLAEQIARWMRGHLNVAGTRGFVVGLSGGVDSAVVARLCQLAAPQSALGVILPCRSDPQDEQDAKLVAEHFQLPTVTVDLTAAFDTLLHEARSAMTALPASLPSAAGAADEAAARLPVANVKPRLRMTALYFVANQLNFMVAGTGNRSELTIGYFTKYGDGGCDLEPLGSLLKSEVRQLARVLGVPQRVIDKPPTAGLWLGQTDEGEMGFTYVELEAYLEEGPPAVAPSVAMKIDRLVRTSEHKRTTPPIFQVQNKEAR